MKRLCRALRRTSALLGVALFVGGCATALPPVVTISPTPVADAASAPDVVPLPPVASASAAAADASAAEAPVDPVQPERHVDLDDRRARTDLWQRIRDGFAIPDLADTYVERRERYYAGQPEYMGRMIDRGSRYLFHIVEEVQRRGMPTELALLPFIESAFNPEALSRARAAGMWQFMPATGRHFDLKQNMFRDDRRDVLASTQAALDYLTKLHDMFGDWHLALAAYNWGEGNVQRAVAKNRRAGKPTHYAALRMPAETRDYVPKLQAMKNIVLRPADFGLTLMPLENHPYFLAVPISRDIDVDLVARLSGLTLEQFRALNPQMNRPLIVAAGTPQVLLPYDNANTFVKALPQHKGPLASWTAWSVQKTMKPSEAAKAVGMDEVELREINNIPPHMLVQAGSTLLVPRSRHRDGDVSVQLADSATLQLVSERAAQRRVTLRAGKRGDSVAAVAKRYGVSAQQVAQWNDMSVNGRFAPGSKVTVWVPNTKGKPTGSASKARPVAKKKAGRGVRVAGSAESSRSR